ncbi:hypothetical protein BH23CHL5_BH23CHL5_27300 [soil metagenome]
MLCYGRSRADVARAPGYQRCFASIGTDSLNTKPFVKGEPACELDEQGDAALSVQGSIVQNVFELSWQPDVRDWTIHARGLRAN